MWARTQAAQSSPRATVFLNATNFPMRSPPQHSLCLTTSKPLNSKYNPKLQWFFSGSGWVESTFSAEPSSLNHHSPRLWENLTQVPLNPIIIWGFVLVRVADIGLSYSDNHNSFLITWGGGKKTSCSRNTHYVTQCNLSILTDADMFFFQLWSIYFWKIRWS